MVNSDEEAAPELRALLLSIDGVRIVAEIDEPGFLSQAVQQFPAEVLLIHLDPNPAAIMDAITPVITARKDQLVTIGMTEDRDAELVVKAMRAGMREFLWKPFPPEQLSEIISRVATNEAPASRRLGRLLPVVGACGGVGATTLVTNLAVELANVETWTDPNGVGGKPKVAVVDLDFRFGQVAMFLDAQPTYTIADLCDTSEVIEAQMIERVMVKHPSGVHVLAHPNDMEQGQRISAGQCAAALGALLEHFDFVVVDGPVRFDPTARAIFDMTDTYLVVIQLLVPAVRSADRLLHELQRGGYNMERVRLICNRFGREAGFLEQADVETTLSRKINYTIPDEWKTSSTAMNVGTPLLEYAPKSRLRQAYQRIALSLATGEEPEPLDLKRPEGETPQRKGLLSFFAGERQ